MHKPGTDGSRTALDVQWVRGTAGRHGLENRLWSELGPMDGQEWAFRGLPAGARRLGGPHCSVGYPNSILAGEGEPKWLLLSAHLSELPGEIDALLEHVSI